MNSPKSLFICRYISMISSIQTFVSRKMSLGKLIPIPCAEWPLLRDLFRHGWPENEVPFNAVQNYIDWIGIDPNIRHLQVLGLGDSWRGNGTFIVLDRDELYFYSLDTSNESLEHALKFIDWNYSYRIYAILDRHQEALGRVLNRLNVRYSFLEDTTHQYRLLKEDVTGEEEVRPPTGFRIGNLAVHHAKYINARWACRGGGTEYAIARCIAWNTSVGLFNEHGELAAWCLLSNLGMICVLQTEECYRRKGFGELVLRAMVAKLVRRGMNASASVAVENFASRKLFQKIGFKKAQTLYYTQYKVDRPMK
ncbi:uncharacterized protein LOC109421194 [Aedes albopictus]|uniref:N-acetyltransferase domain-containing protein n=1 Tax=Aedes albopictus TaxID=7160 RepID=A0ABM1YTG7_AEDAL